MKKAKMGARFQENIYFSETATSTEISNAQSSANSNSFGAKVEGSFGGFEASVAANSEKS